MDDGDADLSARARMRAAARRRREARAEERADILDLVVSGYTYEAIADRLKLSIKSVRRATVKGDRASPTQRRRQLRPACRCCG